MEDLIQRYGDKDVFLLSDQQNKIAIHLYKSFSFEKSKGILTPTN